MHKRANQNFIKFKYELYTQLCRIARILKIPIVTVRN